MAWSGRSCPSDTSAPALLSSNKHPPLAIAECTFDYRIVARERTDKKHNLLYRTPALCRPQRPRSSARPGKAVISLCIEIRLGEGRIVARQLAEERESKLIYIGGCRKEAAQAALSAFTRAKECGWIDETPGQESPTAEDILSALS